MSSKKIHIVSFNIPFPADYGGVIDVFYKLKALKNAGFDITLHCFEYGRNPSPSLNDYCSKVEYYHRTKSLTCLMLPTPFIVNTRKNDDLLKNLMSDDAPVLFEGIHSTWFLNHSDLAKRLKIVRTHNVEHQYYKYLAQSEKVFYKKQFFEIESGKLKRYEPVLKIADHIAAISASDNQYFNENYKNSFLLPAFHPYSNLTVQSGKGKYILYHGNLAVNENINAVKYLCENVLNKVNYPVVIAGNSPSVKFHKYLTSFSNISVVKNPDDFTMNKLIGGAQVNLLVTFQETGIKLKLLSSLFAGRHCIVNDKMICNTGLDSVCEVKNSPDEIIQALRELMEKPITEKAIEYRKEILNELYDNNRNIQILIDKIKN